MGGVSELKFTYFYGFCKFPLQFPNMSSEQLQKIMRRARELSDRISSAESRTGSDFDSTSASGPVQERPKSQLSAAPAYEVRPQYV